MAYSHDIVNAERSESHRFHATSMRMEVRRGRQESAGEFRDLLKTS